MYVNSGYLYNTRVPIKDKSKPLLVGSCGTYRLRTKQKLPTPATWSFINRARNSIMSITEKNNPRSIGYTSREKM